MNLSIKLYVHVGFTVIIVVRRLKNVNAILSFSLTLESISHLFGLHVVLYPLKHLFITYGMFLLCFLFVCVLDCLSGKETVIPLTRWFSFPGQLETVASTLTFQFFCVPLLPHTETSLHPQLACSSCKYRLMIKKEKMMDDSL